MKQKTTLIAIISAFVFIGLFAAVESCSNNDNKEGDKTKTVSKEDMVARGKYLVMVGGCNDCHSPKVMTKEGPVPDTTMLLSGHPANFPMAKIDTSEITPGKWYLAGADLTSWVGPWGISYSANLTPDTATGMGGWTEAVFMKILRSGKFMGIETGRPIMPPMPWQAIGAMTDDDLKAIYTYLRTLKPIKNQVPDYVPPPMISKMGS